MMSDFSLFNFKNKIYSEFLSENSFSPQFSSLKKIYYNYARPVMPLFIRHFLQERYNLKITHLPDFIWDEFAKLVKNEKEWEHFSYMIFKDRATSAIILTHDIETQKGMDFVPEIIALEKKFGFKSSWNIVPYKYKIRDDIIKLIHDSGNELGIHGYNHDGKLYMSKDIFNKRVPYINAAIKKYGAVGFRSPMAHRNLEWLQQLDMLYDASCFDYDPYQPFPGGTGCIWPFKAGKFIELPYTLPQDHVLFYVLKQKDISIWKNKTNWLVKNNGMILSLTHPDYLLEKDHLKLYEEYLAFLKEIYGAWHCLPREIAAHFARKFSATSS